MITLDVYKSEIDLGLTIIYIRTESVIIIKPNGFQSLDFVKTPPPPPGESKTDYGMSDQNVEAVQVEVLSLENKEVDMIENLMGALKDNDLKSLINFGNFDDGIGIKVTIIFSEGNIKDFSLINGATDNQRKLSMFIFDLVIQKSKANKEKLEYFLR